MSSNSAIPSGVRGTIPHTVFRRTIAGAAAAAFVLTVSGFVPGPSLPSRPDGGQRVIRLDGKYVHNVGRLQLQITNIGETGNADNPLRTNVPSAEWPAGSGHDYLWAAGPWIGALDASGIPHVSTATRPQREFSPALTPEGACANLPLDLIADVRESYEGIPGGTRIISSSVDPDDDGDGRIDEDFPNGIDDDADGLCDEDFSSIGQQMLACEYYDDILQVRQTLPEHVPLGIRVRQTSYAWSTPGQNDFVGMDYEIKNVSGRTLRNVMVGIFADMDIGNRGVDQYYLDDQVGLINRDVEYVGADGEIVRRRLQMGYMYDNPDNPANPHENKRGDVPGYIGCMFLHHTTDPSGVRAPRNVGITAFKFFSGEAPFVAGGDPENDAQRYQLMTDPLLNPEGIGEIRSTRPLDYRIVMATGPFQSILPDSTLTISVAWVVGLGLGEGNRVGAGGTLLENAIGAQQIYDGIYTDLDASARTGQCGKEACLRTASESSFLYEAPEACRVRFWSGIPDEPEFDPHRDVLPWDRDADCRTYRQGRFWCPDGAAPGVDPHCASEDTLTISVGNECTYVDLDCNVNTGQEGRERLVNWVAASPLPSPIYPGLNGKGEPRDFIDLYQTRNDSLRLSAWFFPGDRKVTLKWNNFAELLRDAQRGNLKEFVGYRIYKAAGWSRPFGTNGPSRDLWALVGEWRVDPRGTPARPLSELIDPSSPVVRVRDVQVTWDRAALRVSDSSYIETDTLFAVGRNTFVDAHVLNGFPYFYSIVPVSVIPGIPPQQDIVLLGTPNAQNSQVVYPRPDAPSDQRHVVVVPNPYRGGSEWDLAPREDDPSGTKITFMNLPRTRGTVRIFTLAGDLVRDLPFDGTVPADLQYGRSPVTTGNGAVSWNLISRNGQKIVSGIYLFCVDSNLGRDVGRFVVIR